MEKEYVHCQIEEGIAVVTIDNQPALNALNAPTCNKNSHSARPSQRVQGLRVPNHKSMTEFETKKTELKFKRIWKVLNSGSREKRGYEEVVWQILNCPWLLCIGYAKRREQVG